MTRTFVQAVVVCSIAAACARAQEVARPNLTGTVVDGAGDPVASATVFIYTASVKQGYSTYCPSCYSDCDKSTTTDAAGAFTIESLDPELYFNLLTVADGYRPVLTKKIDPIAGPAEVRIEKQPAEPDDLRRVVRGQVVDGDDTPVVGAVVSPGMIHFIGGGGKGGSLEGLDQLVVTNREGRFEIRYTEPVLSMDLEVSARGLAPRFFRACATGSDEHVLALNTGATVSGRLMRDGQPLGGVQMGLVQADRGYGRGWFGPTYIGTDANGFFTFDNVAVGYDWYLYGTMNSMRDQGAVAAQRLKLSDDGEVVDVGDVAVAKAHHFNGQIVLTDGKSIEPGMRLFISRQNAWDSQIIDLAPDGRFEFNGLPTEAYDINAAIRGYHMTDDNPNLNGNGLDGLIDRDFDGFVILMGPGVANNFTLRGELRGRPMRSAERPQIVVDDSN